MIYPATSEKNTTTLLINALSIGEPNSIKIINTNNDIMVIKRDNIINLDIKPLIVIAWQNVLV